jgi:hypothetical protein
MDIDNQRSKVKKEEDPKNLRKIWINDDGPDEHNKNLKSKSKFPDNRIKTAKYNA